MFDKSAWSYLRIVETEKWKICDIGYIDFAKAFDEVHVPPCKAGQNVASMRPKRAGINIYSRLFIRQKATTTST